MRSQKVYSPVTDLENVMKILDKISLFGGLTDEQLYTVFKVLKNVTYNENETIFKKGDTPDYIYIVKSGKIRLAIGPECEPLQIMEFNVGECFGETSLIGILPHTATALAVENTELIVLSGIDLMEFFNVDKDLFGMLILNIAREASRRLHKTDDILMHYVFGN